MNRGRRSIRIDSDLWGAASRSARQQGIDVGTIVRDALTDYVMFNRLTPEQHVTYVRHVAYDDLMDWQQLPQRKGNRP